MRSLHRTANIASWQPGPGKPWVLAYSEEGAVALLDRYHISSGALRWTGVGPASDVCPNRYCLYDLSQSFFGEWQAYANPMIARKRFAHVVLGLRNGVTEPAVTKLKRIEQFVTLEGWPKKVRCYDDGGPDGAPGEHPQDSYDRYWRALEGKLTKADEKVLDKAGSADRYTVVYTGIRDGRCHYVGMSGDPFHPQGIGQHGEAAEMIDRPKYSHLGKKIRFQDLPEDCKRLVWQDYRDWWDLAWSVNELMAEVPSHAQI